MISGFRAGQRGATHWVYRDAYGVLTITCWRPWKVQWIFVVENFG